MQATFYIISQSFTAEGISLAEIITRLSAFVAEYATIDTFGNENKVIVDENIYETILPNGISLGEYIFTTEGAEGEERDLKSALQKMLQRHTESLTLEQICNRIASNSKERCTGIISIVPIEGVANKSQIVYDKDSWYDFRRYHLGLFPGDAIYFMDECKKYYPNMVFHEHNKKSVGVILQDFAQTIIFHLNGIHDILPVLMEEHPDINQTQLLRTLSIKAKFPEIATPEGGDAKQNMKFKFESDKKQDVEVLCELHAKLCYDDSNNGKYHKDKRIYFHKGRPDIAGGKILIGHIGKHL